MSHCDRLYGQIAALTERAEHAESRAEKAEARVAELEAQVAAWSPARCYGEHEPDWEPIESGLRDRIPRKPAEGEAWAPRTTYCLTHGAAYASETWGASSPPVLLGVSCLRCGWKSGPVGRFTVTEVDQAANTVTISSEPITKPEPAKVEAWKVVGCDMFSYERYDLDTYPTKAEADAVASLRNRNAPKDQPGGMHDRYSVEKVLIDAKTAPKTPVPAPEPTETVQKAPPPSPVGAPRSDQAPNSAGQVGNHGPVLGHPSGSESSKLDMSYPAEPTPAPKVPDRITWVPPQRGLTAEEADAWTELLGKFGSPKPREPDVSAEVGLMGALQDRIHKEAGPYRAAKAVRVEASPRPTRPPPGICELWERDGRYFGKYAEDGPDVELSVAQPDTGLVRVLVDPAAAAEVEARTGEVALKKQAEVWRDAVLESIPKRRCEGCANGTALAAHSLCPACVAKSEAAAIGAYDATLRRWAEFFTPPRAGLPSRDEVAAFLEARWPK